MSRLNTLQKSIQQFSTGKYAERYTCALTFLNQMTYSKPTIHTVCTYRCTECPSCIGIGDEDNLSNYMARLSIRRLDE